MKNKLRKALEPAICLHMVPTEEPTGGLLTVDSESQMKEGAGNGASYCTAAVPVEPGTRVYLLKILKDS
jgi:hypothetical protein